MNSITQQNPIRLFVCHVWVEDEDYHRIFEYVESSPNFFYRNTSKPDARLPWCRPWVFFMPGMKA